MNVWSLVYISPYISETRLLRENSSQKSIPKILDNTQAIQEAPCAPMR